jgi:tetratricopeptide (TPR) repeat protein
VAESEWWLEPEVDRTAVVRENGPAAGTILWQVLESVRAALFQAEGSPNSIVLPPPTERDERYRHLRPIAAWLGLLDQLVRDARVAEVESEQERKELINNIASFTAEWLEERAAYATALAYAQIAVAVEPSIPWNAYHVGRLARKAAAPAYAVTWLRRAWRAAHERGDVHVLVLTHEGIGHVHRMGGRLLRARSYFRHAFECARRHDLVALAGDMLADLCLVELELGEAAAATRHWDWALSLFETGDSRLHLLAQNAAGLLMDRYGVYEQAFFLFDALLDHAWRPQERVLLHGQRGRAAAGARLTDDFELSWNQVFASVRDPGDRRADAAALIQLAHGAALLRQWHRAEFALSQAMSIARAAHDDVTALQAELLLDARPEDVDLARGWLGLNSRLHFQPEMDVVEHFHTSGTMRVRQRDRGDLFTIR